ncbi:alpha/beta hydrolase-fold protein [Streptococcus sp. NLN76]|uniref:alpha/beta hydrolase n=1 Tax=Streptococcus sp. NLN76 TaxID=2822800 RepID=UPI0018A9A64F|nr:alpha/beta hydrolase-fold protein [Streptococcus sp. NLN76]MBF8970011.1 esterase [Streptococcus sp. NLN76]
MTKRILMSVGPVVLLLLGLGLWWTQPWLNPSQSTDSVRTSSASINSRLETLSYETDYEGQSYEKQVVVYQPDSYQEGQLMNVFYLMHGSGMDNVSFAETMQPLFDQWIAAGEMEPMLVVFPTYYPDRSFVVSNYSQDYPLNHFFATDEVTQVLQLVEGRFSTHAASTSAADLEVSRNHRAFGGYSMGGITTWDVLVENSRYFHDYMPMAGDSWIDRVTGRSGDEAIAQTLVSGLEANNYGPEDVTIIAMVGENDGTKYSMIPQIEALRVNTRLFNNRNLIYWENANGGHDQASLEAEVQHGVPYLFQAK